ncbi:ankyrin repeat domain-containing protein [Endozoicomonas sp. YOMI1]|uniref:ankyrin repeat domain-containing protein n=1 Tax=Endozoicomonas sp. YOMI1 TaxID=2828739 RepID=UPI00214875C2|nr:ankyrin repeat domain-containing protein [Endozoicomonas sp. YOMI1]
MNINIQSLEIVTNYLFNTIHAKRYLHTGTGNTLSPDVKKVVWEVYHLQNLNQCDKGSHDTPLLRRDIQIIHVLPTLAQSRCFFDSLNEHAQRFLERRTDKTVVSKEVKVALEELKMADSLKKFVGIGRFFESILDKHDNKKPITHSEKTVFRFLLTGIFKIDPGIDALNSANFLKMLSRYFHPDKSGKSSELYSCVLSQGLRLAKLINDLWSVEKTEQSGSQKINLTEISYDPLVTSIYNLSQLHYLDGHWAREKIKKEMQTLNATHLKDNQKEALIMSIITSDESGLLDILMNRVRIDNLKIYDDTPLIYAIKKGNESVIKSLIKTQDINALGFDGRTPLQIAIHCYEEWNNNHKDFSYRSNPYERIINFLLDSPGLCVDNKNSFNLTALGDIALLPKIDSSHLQFINKLINRGANIDQIFLRQTVRSLLEKKLKEDQFAEIEKLADNLEDIRNGVEFHGDEIVELIAEYNKTHYGRFSALEKVREAITNKKTLRQKKSGRKTVLMAAIESDAVSFIKLLSKRPDFTIDQLTTKGETPLEYARKIGAQNIVKYLSTDISKNSGDTSQSRKRPLTTTTTAEGAAPK